MTGRTRTRHFDACLIPGGGFGRRFPVVGIQTAKAAKNAKVGPVIPTEAEESRGRQKLGYGDWALALKSGAVIGAWQLVTGDSRPTAPD